MSRSVRQVSYQPEVMDFDQANAESLMESIKEHLSDVAYFTRDDLLYIPAFAHVATITRYRYVCMAVHHLLETGQLIAKSRTELVIRGTAYSTKYKDVQNHIDEYSVSVRQLIANSLARRVFRINNVVDAWKNDQHLTNNAKRVIARECVRYMKKEGLIKEITRHVYSYE